MNTFVLICAYLYIYIHDLGKCVQIIYTVTCVNMLIYWILVIFLYMCVCNLFLGGGSCYYMAFSDSVGALLGRNWNCKCSCHCLNMPEFV